MQCVCLSHRGREREREGEKEPERSERKADVGRRLSSVTQAVCHFEVAFSEPRPNSARRSAPPVSRWRRKVTDSLLVSTFSLYFFFFFFFFASLYTL